MPKPEHIEALAAELNGDRYAAELIFDAITRDPATQDAVIAALVEGGRLIEQQAEWCRCGHYRGKHKSDGCHFAIGGYRCACTLFRPQWREWWREASGPFARLPKPARRDDT